ncbi:DUF4091 domain-containing protein [bacterium]|nr:DUF4091 domain-containing protein [bacterium]
MKSHLPLILLCALIATSGCKLKVDIKGDSENKPEMQAWPVPIETRIYSGAFTRNPEEKALRVSGLAGEFVSAQVAVRCDEKLKNLRAELRGLKSESGATLDDSAVRVRYGAYLKVDETMNLTEDPLLEVDSVEAPAGRAQAVWVTVAVPREAAPGVYSSVLRVLADDQRPVTFDFSLEVLPVKLPAPSDWTFYLNIWQDPSGVARAHGVKVWSEEHWALLARYAENLAAHGLKSIMTSVVYDPWKSQSGYPFDTMVEWKYPGEWTGAASDKFEWDFSIFDRYVQLMMDAGIKEKIDMYALVMGPGSTQDANIRYLDTTSGQYRTAELKVGEPRWAEAWKAFLPALRTHLKEKGWFEIAELGFDEKTPEVMKVIFDFLLANAKDFRVALSGGFPGDERKWGDEIVFHITEILDPQRWKEIKPLVEKMHADPKRYVTLYTACNPYYPNTFIYSSLRESRLMAWLAWSWGFDGYTRWAVNAFPENVWEQPNYKWHSGDMYFVYPGPDGPLDSMRWELLRQGIQDYEALHIAWKAAEKAGRADLLDNLRRAVEEGSMLDACHVMPPIAEAREAVNEVLRQLGPALE